jgi:hypothetical protein
MGLIGSVLLCISGLLVAILVPVATKLITDDVKAWLPWITNRLIERAVRSLPEGERQRYAEEWQSHVNEIPGDLSQIVVALGFNLAAGSISHSLNASVLKRMTQRVTEKYQAYLLRSLARLQAEGVILDARMQAQGERFYALRDESRAMREKAKWFGKMSR